LGRLLDLALPGPDRGKSLPGDIRYTLPLPPETLERGGTVRISVPGDTGRQVFDVRIPPGAREGTRLRLTGKGHGNEGRGDLYLEIRESR
jgi:DnaJ-class molecular chaperone